MKKWGLILLSFFISLSAMADGYVFVGNGGHGVIFEEDDKVYLLDLVSMGIHQQSVLPYDPNSSHEFYSIYHNLPKLSFSYPRYEMALLLIELDKAVPDISSFLIETMRNYSWTLTEYKLRPVDNIIDPILTEDNIRIVQIANRLGTIIRIHKSSWEKMNTLNQVALIVHELIYSLVVPKKNPNGYFSQSSLTAREVTGRLFMHDFQTSTFAKMLQNIPRTLGIAFPIKKRDELDLTEDGIARVKLSYGDFAYTSRIFYSPAHESETINIVRYHYSDSYSERLQRFCDKAFTYALENAGRFWIEIEATPPSKIEVTSVSVPYAVNRDQVQSYVDLFYNLQKQPPLETRVITGLTAIMTPLECKKELDDNIRNILIQRK